MSLIEKTHFIGRIDEPEYLQVYIKESQPVSDGNFLYGNRCGLGLLK